MSYLFYYLFRALFYFILIAVFATVLLSVFSPFSAKSGSASGGDFFNRFKFMVISSGSMKPSLNTGDLIFINARPKQINKNEIVVFKDPHGSEFFITHRVKDVFQDGEENFIQTKGDANSSLDNWRVQPENIKGEVLMAFPSIGYILEFAKTFSGFVILIIVPSVIMIANELAKIKLYLNKI